MIKINNSNSTIDKTLKSFNSQVMKRIILNYKSNNMIKVLNKNNISISELKEDNDKFYFCGEVVFKNIMNEKETELVSFHSSFMDFGGLRIDKDTILEVGDYYFTTQNAKYFLDNNDNVKVKE